MKEKKLELLKNLTVLIVEDDDELRENLKTMTSIFFKEVFTASNGADALKIFNSNKVNVMIVDYVLPIMDGYELCKEIRKLDKSIPITVLSNCNDNEKLMSVVPLRLTNYIIKPIDYTGLTKMLLEIVDRLEEENLLRVYLNKNIIFDKTKNDIIKDGVSTSLTKSEVKILNLLIEEEGKIVSNEMIDNLFDSLDSKSNSSIKNHIYKLRQKLHKDLILNVKDIGYILKLNS